MNECFVCGSATFVNDDGDVECGYHRCRQIQNDETERPGGE